MWEKIKGAALALWSSEKVGMAFKALVLAAGAVLADYFGVSAWIGL